MNKNAYSTIDLSARRSAQVGIKMVIDISDKIVVVTGASRGIGKEIALNLAKENASVIMTYNSNKMEAEELFQNICSFNDKCMLMKCDVTKADEVRILYKNILNKYNKVDVLINNAGICDDNRVQMMSLEQWAKVIEVNLTGCFICSRTISKNMILNQSGKILNVSSIKGLEGCVGQSNYSASKAGVIAFTKSFAKEVGKFNVAVNAVCPGFIVTDLNRNNEEKRKIAESRSVLDYTNSLKDVVNFVLYYVSDMLRGASGQTFILDSRI